MAELKITGVDKVFGRSTEVLRRIELEAKDGEFLVLVGPSGCGKSTLLRIIAGLEQPTRGDIFIDNQRANDLSPSDRNVAMVFQDYALYPHMSVRENLAFGLRNQRLPREARNKRIEDASHLLQLDQLLERKPSQLSGGQRQRVAIGRAITRKPKLFLFDEPLSNLDAQLRAEMRLEIAAIHARSGSTSIYVTHDQVEAMTLATRIAVLNRGVIQQIAEPMDLYKQPVNRFVAAFIGHPSINFIEGELELAGSQKLFHISGGGGQRLDLSGEQTPLQSGAYVLGVRPESVKPRLDREVCHLRVQGVLIEPYGHENHLIAAIGGHKITSRYSSPERMQRYRSLRGEQIIEVQFNLADLHWFETGTQGRRLSPQAPGVLT